MSNPDVVAAAGEAAARRVTRPLVPGNVQIAVVNQAKKYPVSDAALTLMVQAVGLQLPDFAASWGLALPSLRISHDGKVQRFELPIYLLDDADQQGALGYHDEDSTGHVYGRVFVGTILNAGGTMSTGSLSVSGCLSHEVLEACGDEHCNQWADNGDGTNTLVANEACDPVEQDQYHLNVSGIPVAVSNWVTPAWFDSKVSGVAYDRLGNLSAPGTMTTGGYEIIMAAGAVTQRFADDVSDPTRTAMKAEPGSRTGRRLNTPAL